MSSAQATTTRTVLAEPEVRKLWAAALMGSLAVWIAQVALIVAVLEHHAGSCLAWVLLASTHQRCWSGSPAERWSTATTPDG